MQFKCLGAAAAIIAAAGVAAQDNQTLDWPVGHMEAWQRDSGEISNDGAAAEVSFSEQIHVDQAIWIRVYFGKTELAPGSVLRISSLLDGEVQELDAGALANWGNTSAYFNGDTVNVELLAAPKTNHNRVVIEQVALEIQPVQAVGSNGQCGICGGDDRVPSSETWTGRLLPPGCTASVWNPDSCLVSAGHCVSGGMVIQFNVPNSQPNCGTVNPPIADQFPVTVGAFFNGGPGNDWAVLRSGLNNLGQTPYQRFGQLRPIAQTVAPNGAAVTVNGYGVDQTCTLSQTQQFHSGPINAVNPTLYNYSVDIRGGNSGSALVRNGEIIGIVTHCPCPNIATRVDNPGFTVARAQCPPFTPAPIATGPSSAADGYLLVSPDAYGSFSVPFVGGTGPMGDAYNPSGAPAVAAAVKSDGFFLFRSNNQRELLSANGEWQALVDDGTLAREVTAEGSPSDTNGDGVDDTVLSAFDVTGGTTDLSFDLTQRVQQDSVAATVAVLTQDYTITNNSASSITFTLVRVLDASLVWAGDSTNDSVGTGTNGSALERHVYIQEAGNAATAITLSSPTGDAYVGGKHGIDPDGAGGSPPYDMGTDTEIWNAFGVPTGWRNHVAGVGYNLNGTSGAAPAGSSDPRDAFIALEIPVTLAGGSSTTVTLRHTYGATTPASPAAPCPWDCGDGNGSVSTVDFLALLGTWGGSGPCDFDGGGISTTDFLALLGHWGLCP